MYKVSESTIQKVFNAWTNVIHRYFGTLNFWSLRSIEENAFTIIVCALSIKYRSEKATIESYKYIIALDSKSNVCFSSGLYDPTTTNHDVLIESGLINKLDSSKDIALIDNSYGAAELLKAQNIRTSLPKTAKQSQGKTVYRVKQNKITCDIFRGVYDKNQLEKIVLVSNMLVNYIQLVQSK